MTQLTATHSRSMFPSVFVSPAPKIKQSLISSGQLTVGLTGLKIPPFTISFTKMEGIPSGITDREWPALDLGYFIPIFSLQAIACDMQLTDTWVQTS